MLYPLTFQPIFKERVWGGRNLAQLYGKKLPPNVPIGESWEISDRPGDASVIANGPLSGKDLHWLMENNRGELLGYSKATPENRFPLLVKLLDAQEKLSLQVHPPASKAAELRGEPKTEMWYIADAAPGAELYVGLKPGATREEFERKVRDGSVADCFHRVPVRAGDTMFLPSGRVHAIGAGLLIFEIQQNSDTTYRVFDWNRLGLDGKPREMHVAESLASIDFNDFAPALVSGALTGSDVIKSRVLVRDPLFVVVEFQLAANATLPFLSGRLQIIACVSGRLHIDHKIAPVDLAAGQFCLMPASVGKISLQAASATTLLRVEVGL